MPNSCASSTVETKAAAVGRSRVALCSLDSLPKGQGRCFAVGRLKVAVFRERDGSVAALDGLCPHLGGPLADGLIGAGVVVCPLHAYRFRLSDGTGVDNGFRAGRYPVVIEDGRVFVQLPPTE